MTFKEFVQRTVSVNKIFFPAGFICNQITVPVAKAHNENLLLAYVHINTKEKSKFLKTEVLKTEVAKTEVLKTEVLKTQVLKN